MDSKRVSGLTPGGRCRENYGQEAARLKVGDFVRVSGGPAYVKGQPIKGRIEEIEPTADSGVRTILVRVASGGLWGFAAEHLRVVKA